MHWKKNLVIRIIVAAFVISCFHGCEEGNSASNYESDDEDLWGENNNPSGDSDTDSDSDADTDSDTDSDGDSDTDAGEAVCDEQDFKIEFVPIRLMVLLDMSGSMADNSPSKWNQAVQAITIMLNTWGQEQIDFGLDVFPNNGMCGVLQPVISDTAPDNASNIITRLNALGPDGATPLYLALQNFTSTSYAQNFTSPEAASYLLLVSDGGDTCGINGNPYGGGATPAQLGSVADQLCANGISTYVIGFGEGVEPDQLNAIVNSGCTGAPTYFDAQNQQQLQEALEEIAESVVSCTYDIEEPDATADPDEVNFYFDDEVVPYDEDCQDGTGWTWTNDEHTQMEFCDEACERLKTGQVEEISAKFGCPTIDID